jgi:AcrR family transcriptional regulator
MSTDAMGTTGPTVTRRRNAADARERLLSAAGELFADRGYEGTTIREVGARAGVDPALIARYFGSKSRLYLASLQAEGPRTDAVVDLRDPEYLKGMLDRLGRRGPTPTLYAAIRPHDDSELQDAAMNVLEERLVRPAEQVARAAERDRSRLRAEIVSAAVAGIVLSRTTGALGELHDASSAEVAALVAQMFGTILGD